MPDVRQWLAAHYDVLKDFSGPVATGIAALVAAGITFYFNRVQARIAKEQANTALLQARLAEVRLQHDLYDRRYKLYDISRRFVLKIVQHHGAQTEWIMQHTADIGDAPFLLDQATAEYLEHIRKRAIRLNYLDKVRDLPEYAEKRPQIIDEAAQLTMWFSDQFEALVDRFKPFLSLDHLVTEKAHLKQTSFPRRARLYNIGI